MSGLRIAKRGSSEIHETPCGNPLERPSVAQRCPGSTMPAGLRVVQVGDEFVLGIHRDDLGLETVRKHSLTPTRPEG